MIGFSFPFQFATVSIFIYGTPVHIVKRNVLILLNSHVRFPSKSCNLGLNRVTTNLTISATTYLKYQNKPSSHLNFGVTVCFGTELT